MFQEIAFDIIKKAFWALLAQAFIHSTCEAEAGGDLWFGNWPGLLSQFHSEKLELHNETMCTMWAQLPVRIRLVSMVQVREWALWEPLVWSAVCCLWWDTVASIVELMLSTKQDTPLRSQNHFQDEAKHWWPSKAKCNDSVQSEKGNS